MTGLPQHDFPDPFSPCDRCGLHVEECIDLPFCNQAAKQRGEANRGLANTKPDPQTMAKALAQDATAATTRPAAAESAPVVRHPMWCDALDFDLPKLIPRAWEIIAPIADVMLVTEGGETDGNLNHPAVWNGERTMLSFFGFKDTARPAPYTRGATSNVVTATAWDVFRDAWPHGYLIKVEQYSVWDTYDLASIALYPLLYEKRGIRPLTDVLRAGILRSIGASATTGWNPGITRNPVRSVARGASPHD